MTNPTCSEPGCSADATKEAKLPGVEWEPYCETHKEKLVSIAAEYGLKTEVRHV